MPRQITRYIIVAIALLLIAPLANAAESTKGMVKLKGGCFAMGTADLRSDEAPVHEVCLSDFSIDRHEVTQAEYFAVMGTNPSEFFDPRRPVERVSWQQAADYCKKIKKRLPTEAEWEYAARDGGKYIRWAGTDNLAELDDYAWGKDNSGGFTQPVALKKPTALGLYDMSGNVAEWVIDWYDPYPAKSLKNPKGPKTSNARATRGGSFESDPQYMRTHFREGATPDIVYNFYGFRCVKD